MILENRRRYPRILYQKPVGVLFKGHYFITICYELGEGGLSLTTFQTLNLGDLCCVTLPNHIGGFYVLKADVRNSQKWTDQQYIYGLKFLEYSNILRGYFPLFFLHSQFC